MYELWHRTRQDAQLFPRYREVGGSGCQHGRACVGSGDYAIHIDGSTSVAGLLHPAPSPVTEPTQADLALSAATSHRHFSTASALSAVQTDPQTLLLVTDEITEILALRHQITVLERQLGADTRVRFALEDRAFLAALLTSLPREVLRWLRLLVRPDTILRWHRDLLKQRHARTCRPKRPGRPPTVRSIRALILRLVRENPSWGYRRVHGELATLGIKVAPSTVWEILKQEGVAPSPERASVTWADFLRSQADALLACDFLETVTLNGQRH